METSTAAPKDTLATLADQLTEMHGAQFSEIARAEGGKANVAIVPKGKTVVDLMPILAQYLVKPLRRKGTAALRDVQSFVDHLGRFAGSASAVFANPDRKGPTLTAVFDYHPASSSSTDTDWLDHRAVYAPQFSDQWTAWVAKDGVSMDQGEFAEFVEAHITDVIVPNFDDPNLKTFATLVGGKFAEPSDLLALSRGLAVNVDIAVRNAVTLTTGAIAVQYDETHKDGAGLPVNIANLDDAKVPVFLGSPEK